MSVVQFVRFYYRDPRFIREFKAKYCVEVFAEHLSTKKKYVHLERVPLWLAD
jgi:hypothetical protein